MLPPDPTGRVVRCLLGAMLVMAVAQAGIGQGHPEPPVGQPHLKDDPDRLFGPTGGQTPEDAEAWNLYHIYSKSMMLQRKVESALEPWQPVIQALRSGTGADTVDPEVALRITRYLQILREERNQQQAVESNWSRLFGGYYGSLQEHAGRPEQVPIVDQDAARGVRHVVVDAMEYRLRKYPFSKRNAVSRIPDRPEWPATIPTSTVPRDVEVTMTAEAVPLPGDRVVSAVKPESVVVPAMPPVPVPVATPPVVIPVPLPARTPATMSPRSPAGNVSAESWNHLTSQQRFDALKANDPAAWKAFGSVAGVEGER